MIDKAKRSTLKNAVRVGVGVTALSTSAGTFAKLGSTSKSIDSNHQGLSNDLIDLADIEVMTNVSPVTNDLEVVFTNTGNVDARITDMTPSAIYTPRGQFDFDAVLAKGDVHLKVGESIRVPMKRRKVVLDGSSLSQRTYKLAELLKNTISITTDGDSLAAINVVKGPVYA